MKKRFLTLAIAAAMSAVALTPATALAAPEDKAHKVEVCRETSSAKHPSVVITISHKALRVTDTFPVEGMCLTDVGGETDDPTTDDPTDDGISDDYSG